jgi:hypothetical protein
MQLLEKIDVLSVTVLQAASLLAYLLPERQCDLGAIHKNLPRTAWAEYNVPHESDSGNDCCRYCPSCKGPIARISRVESPVYGRVGIGLRLAWSDILVVGHLQGSSLFLVSRLVYSLSLIMKPGLDGSNRYYLVIHDSDRIAAALFYIFTRKVTEVRTPPDLLGWAQAFANSHLHQCLSEVVGAHTPERQNVGLTFCPRAEMISD